MEISNVLLIGHGIPGPGWRLKDAFYGERLYHIYSGKGGCRFRGKNYTFEPNTLCFIPYSSDFEPYFDTEDPIVHSYIDCDIIPPILTNDIITATVPDDPLILSALDIFRRVGQDFIQNGFYCDDEIYPLIKGVVLYLLEYLLKQNDIHITNDGQIMEALRVIHQRYNEPIGVDMLAEMCNMNKNNFIRRFSKEIGITPYAYLKKLRMRVARRLRAGGATLTEIAEAVGYSDATSLLHALNKE